MSSLDTTVLLKATAFAVAFVFGSWLSGGAQSDVRLVVADLQTEKPLPYATVWKVNTDEGTATNESGVAMLGAKPSDSLRTGYVGYRSRVVPASARVDTIYLEEAQRQLGEVTVRSKKNKFILGKTKIKRNYFISTSKSSQLYAKEFVKPNDDLAFLNQVNVGVATHGTKTCVFGIRVFEAVPGRPVPGKEITDKPIFVKVFGHEVCSIKIPVLPITTRRFYVAVQVILIEQNKVAQKVTYPGEKSKRVKINYNPSLYLVPDPDRQGMWIFYEKKQSWQRLPLPSERPRTLLMHCELTYRLSDLLTY